MFSDKEKQTLRDAVTILLKAINSKNTDSDNALENLVWETKLIDHWHEGQKSGQKIMANFLAWESFELCRAKIKNDFVADMLKQREESEWFKVGKPQKFSDKQMNVINKAWDELINGDEKPVRKAKAIEPVATSFDDLENIPF